MRKPCCDEKNTKKGAWTKQEDHKLIDYIATHGEGCWRTLPKQAGLRRCGKSCRLRWINYLRPDIKRGNFAQDEEDLIVKLHALLGNRWSLIAGRLPGRTDNEVRNYWNSHIRRKLINMGIDPNNHRLNQSIPYHENKQQEKLHNILPSSKQPLMKNITTNDDHEQLSDAASGLDLDHDINLNLDLTIAFPSTCDPLLPLSNNVGEKKKQEIINKVEVNVMMINNNNKKKKSTKEVQEGDQELPTLVLFS